MASELICETCGLSVPPDTAVCPRDGTVVLASFHIPTPAPAEPKVNVHVASDAGAYDTGAKDPLIGLKLGEYELRARVGVGGMGLVYEGIQPLIGKRVAVKVLRPELAHSTEQVERLLAEARAVNAIRHRGIIDIFGFGQVPDGRQYIIMEFLDGQALDTVLAEKTKLPVQEALSVLDEVLAALAAAHGAGVVHRDLKPSNIFLVRQPDGSRYVKVLDFGLAKRAQTPTGRSAQTRTDMVVGTPEYMAPEQARGQEVGPMTDLYALGVVTFEMVTGRLPFVGTSPVDLLMKHVEARPPRPSEFLPELPPALDAFILQMLTKDPETRPNSADALRQQLNKLRRTLRSTRSNASAPAPLPGKPRKADDVDSRRPTTPVPVPPEVQGKSPELSSKELRAAAVGSPAFKRMAVAGGLGAAVLLLAGGVALVSRGPTEPPAPAPVATTPALPAPAPAAHPGTSTAVAATPPPVAAEPQNEPPATAKAPTTASEELNLAPLTPAATGAKPSKAMAQSGASRTGDRIKPSRDEALSAEEPSDPGTAVNGNALLKRIELLEEEFSTLSLDENAALDEAQTRAAQVMLDKCRRQARTARTSNERSAVAAKLDYFERVYLKKKP